MTTKVIPQLARDFYKERRDVHDIDAYIHKKLIVVRVMFVTDSIHRASNTTRKTIDNRAYHFS